MLKFLLATSAALLFCSPVMAATKNLPANFKVVTAANGSAQAVQMNSIIWNSPTTVIVRVFDATDPQTLGSWSDLVFDCVGPYAMVGHQRQAVPSKSVLASIRKLACAAPKEKPRYQGTAPAAAH